MALQAKAVCLLDFATPDLIPADLLPVGLVDSRTDDCLRIKRTAVVARADAARDQPLWGSVTYATVDLVPVGMRKVAVV